MNIKREFMPCTILRILVCFENDQKDWNQEEMKFRIETYSISISLSKQESMSFLLPLIMIIDKQTLSSMIIKQTLPLLFQNFLSHPISPHFSSFSRRFGIENGSYLLGNFSNSGSRIFSYALSRHVILLYRTLINSSIETNFWL